MYSVTVTVNTWQRYEQECKLVVVFNRFDWSVLHRKNRSVWKMSSLSQDIWSSHASSFGSATHSLDLSLSSWQVSLTVTVTEIIYIAPPSGRQTTH